MVRTLALLLLMITAAEVAAAEKATSAHWPRWRGGGDDGAASKGTYAVKWNATKGLAWKVPLPGKGCSTPIVRADHIILTAPVDGHDAVLAFDWSGKRLWQTPIGREVPGKHRNGSGSNPSAVTDGEQIFACYKSGNLAALDYDGKILWKLNLVERFGKGKLYWDFGTSPILTETDVVMAILHEGESYLAAFDQQAGELSWYVSRNYKTPTEGDHGYASPILIDHRDTKAVMVWGAERLTAHDVGSGKLLWSCANFNPEQKRNWVTVASPTISGNMAIVPYGRGSRIAGIRLGGSGDVTETHRSWTRTDTGSFVPTPAAQDGKVYLLRDRGEVECIDASSGKTLWKDQLPKHRASYYASPTIADGKLYAAREDGVVFVAAVAGKFAVLSENNMGERVIASPVPVADRILIRGEKHLFCVAPPATD